MYGGAKCRDCGTVRRWPSPSKIDDSARMIWPELKNDTNHNAMIGRDTYLLRGHAPSPAMLIPPAISWRLALRIQIIIPPHLSGINSDLVANRHKSGPTSVMLFDRYAFNFDDADLRITPQMTLGGGGGAMEERLASYSLPSCLLWISHDDRFASYWLDVISRWPAAGLRPASSTSRSAAPP